MESNDVNIAPKKRLVVWDFDCSLISDNSDTWLTELLVPDLDVSRLYKDAAGSLMWTEVMDKAMAEMHARGLTAADIERALSTIPFHEDALKSLELLRANQCDMIIISHANTVFIDTILKAHNAKQYFPDENIFTHPAHFDETGRLMVGSYHGRHTPHDCGHCIADMCKGKLLDARLKQQYESVMYVGDSDGDWCPCLRLDSFGHILSRKDYQLSRTIIRQRQLVQATVHFWDGYTQLLRTFSKLLSL
eukprot:TRINITY_DN2463_c0_g1_i5.p1 TRINITY_DN2463_c0_g1~~TRINITY_DN2463_c0_g1_i5.p1  ORF type:complete len:248 (+),score=75.79 TRINITY_DN2463_c0_g1_i5:56-799(+)